MTEENYMQFHIIMAIAKIFLYAFGMAFFFKPFVPSKKKLLIVFSVYLSMYLLSLYLSDSRYPINGWVFMFAVLAFLLLASGILGIERALAALLGGIFFCVRNLSMMMMYSVTFMSDRYLIQKARTAQEVFRYGAISFGLIGMLEFILFSVMLYLVYYQLVKKKIELHIKELCCLLLLPSAGILFVSVMVRIQVIIKEDAYIWLYEQFPAFLGIVPAAAALFYGGILITIAVYRKMTDLQEERERYLVQEQQIRAIQERTEDVERFYEGVRRMKHEMKNHLTNINGLVQSGSYEDIKNYIAKMDESMDILEFSVKTGNPVTDVIINDKLKAAGKKGIRFCPEFFWPDSEGYNAYDVGIILNNLLTNALEACSRMGKGKKYIYLTGRQEKKFFLINIRNSFEGEILFDKRKNLPVSSKERSASEKYASLHGIGLSNVKREVEKYMGDIDIGVEGNEFCVTVMLQEVRICM